MSSPSLPTARLPLRPSPAAPATPLTRRGAPVRSLAASPAPALALKPLVSKAPASGSYCSALLLHRRRYALPETAAVTAVPEPVPKVCFPLHLPTSAANVAGGNVA